MNVTFAVTPKALSIRLHGTFKMLCIHAYALCKCCLYCKISYWEPQYSSWVLASGCFPWNYGHPGRNCIELKGGQQARASQFEYLQFPKVASPQHFQSLACKMWRISCLLEFANPHWLQHKSSTGYLAIESQVTTSVLFAIRNNIFGAKTRTTQEKSYFILT